MGEFHLTVGQCKCCIIDGIEVVDNKVLKRELTESEACKELGVKTRDYIIHYENHVRNKITTALANDVEAMKTNLLDTVATVTSSIERTQSICIEVFAELKDNVLDNEKMLAIYNGLEKSIADNVTKLASLTGELNEAQQINVQHNVINIDKIEGKMMENLCPACKQKMGMEILKLAE